MPTGNTRCSSNPTISDKTSVSGGGIVTRAWSTNSSSILLPPYLRCLARRVVSPEGQTRVRRLEVLGQCDCSLWRSTRSSPRRTRQADRSTVQQRLGRLAVTGDRRRRKGFRPSRCGSRSEATARREDHPAGWAREFAARDRGAGALADFALRALHPALAPCADRGAGVESPGKRRIGIRLVAVCGCTISP